MIEFGRFQIPWLIGDPVLLPGFVLNLLEIAEVSISNNVVLDKHRAICGKYQPILKSVSPLRKFNLKFFIIFFLLELLDVY